MTASATASNSALAVFVTTARHHGNAPLRLPVIRATTGEEIRRHAGRVPFRCAAARRLCVRHRPYDHADLPNEPNLREVYAFVMNGAYEDPMMGAPTRRHRTATARPAPAGAPAAGEKGGVMNRSDIKAKAMVVFRRGGEILLNEVREKGRHAERLSPAGRPC
jgi:hypothetical protein